MQLQAPYKQSLAANKSLCVVRRVCKHPFPANQVFHSFNSLLIAIYMAVVYVIKYSRAQEQVSTSSPWLATYVLSSHIGRVPQCRVNNEFPGNCVGSLLGSLVSFSINQTIIITNALLSKQTGSYYIITDFNRIWDISQLYPIYLNDIIVITLDLGSALVLCNNNDIILVPGYNYNLNSKTTKELKGTTNRFKFKTILYTLLCGP